FFFDTVWDVSRLIDYLQTRDDVDAKRIGLYGVSKGGIETYLTAAVDTRVAVAVPCIGLESFRWADENDSWHSRIGTIQTAFDAAAKEAGVAKPDGDFLHQFYSRVAPGIDGEFDGPSMAPLIAPRPLMTINGEIDPRTPLPGLKLCTDAAAAAYRAAGVEDHFLVRIQPKTAHHVNPDSQAAAVDWFVKWLKP
ncbi:MAG: alpha/beta hydrolase, partial [Tepidisphaeraceae bacterium]